MIIIDEAAHIDVNLFYEVIVPILEMTMTALLAISTPLDEFNYYSKLVDMKDDKGEPFFVIIKAGRICDDCSRLPYEQMLKCDHVEDTAHWKNPHKLKRLKVLFEGDEARGLRELGGIAASNFTACFQKPYIQAFMNAPRYVTRNRPSTIYITVDPNGGGPSKMAIASGFYDGKRLVVSHSFLFFLLKFLLSFSVSVIHRYHLLVDWRREGAYSLSRIQCHGLSEELRDEKVNVELVGPDSVGGVEGAVHQSVYLGKVLRESLDLHAFFWVQSGQ